jgi:hypothetical protein
MWRGKRGIVYFPQLICNFASFPRYFIRLILLRGSYAALLSIKRKNWRYFWVPDSVNGWPVNRTVGPRQWSYRHIWGDRNADCFWAIGTQWRTVWSRLIVSWVDAFVRDLSADPDGLMVTGFDWRDSIPRIANLIQSELKSICFRITHYWGKLQRRPSSVHGTQISRLDQVHPSNKTGGSMERWRSSYWPGPKSSLL